jgi:hypothetical protein
MALGMVFLSPALALAHEGNHADLPPRDPTAVIQRYGGRVEVYAEFTAFKLPRKKILAWIGTALDGIHTFYGRLPVKTVKIYIRAFAGRGIQNGTTYGRPEPHITISLGSETEAVDLRNDWKMTHEFVHLSVPIMKRGQTWLDEGIATYVEPLARYMVGNVDEDQIWRWLMEGIPHALNVGGDGGLDDTRKWGTIYWGGALYCLLADIEIRRATGNEKGLRDALSYLVQQGHVIVTGGDAPVLLRKADAALGITVLSDLYERFKSRPYQVDPGFIWRRLGVSMDADGKVRYDHGAPWAATRRAMVED